VLPRGACCGTAGLVVATIALASLIGNPLGGAVADRWTPRRALTAGLITAAAGSAALAIAHDADAPVRGGWPARARGGGHLARPGHAAGQSGGPGPGGIDTRGLCLAFAANMATVVGAQLFVLRRLAGRYNGLGTLAFTVGFLIGPAGGAAALGAGWGTGLFAVTVLACVLAAIAALRLHRHLPPGTNQIAAATAVA
jgi:MFS family permease